MTLGLTTTAEPEPVFRERDTARRQILLRDLPRGFLQPYRPAVLRIALLLAVFLTAEALLIFGVAPFLLWSVMAGIALGLLMFLAHDLTHGTIIRGRMKYPLELVAWGFNAFPPTLWQILHNKWHHQYTNTPEDPDRMFTSDERQSLIRRVYAFVFVPLEGSGAPRHPLMLLLFFAYTIKYVIAALSNRPLKVCTSVPHFSARERRAIAFEELLIFAAYGGLVTLAVLAGQNWLHALVWQALVPLLLSSAIAMAFIFTQHVGNPLHDETDILSASTSLRLPRLVHELSSHVGYHVEHHLFPAMNPRYYPAVSKQIAALWPLQYRLLGFWPAWRRIFKAPVFRPVEPVKVIAFSAPAQEHTPSLGSAPTAAAG